MNTTNATDIVRATSSSIPEAPPEAVIEYLILKATHDTAVRLRPRSSAGKGTAAKP